MASTAGANAAAAAAAAAATGAAASTAAGGLNLASMPGANPLEKMINLISSARARMDFAEGEHDEHTNPDIPNVLDREDLALGREASKVQASISLHEGMRSNTMELGEAFFLDEAELVKVDDDDKASGWEEGLPPALASMFGDIKAAAAAAGGGGGGDGGDGDHGGGDDDDDDDDDADDDSGGRHRAGCAPKPTARDFRWRRRYRCRRRAYLTDDPWIQRHAYWRPCGNGPRGGLGCGLSPVTCRVSAKVGSGGTERGGVATREVGCTLSITKSISHTHHTPLMLMIPGPRAPPRPRVNLQPQRLLLQDRVAL